jgi:hypothetical protein
MTNRFGNNFHHRHNRNGTHDSICSACAMTVATSSDDSLLAAFEDAHICDPVRAYQVSEGAYHSLNALNLNFGLPRPHELWH